MMENFKMNSYDDIPYRSIKKTPFIANSLQSYGLIVKARDTGRWLLVQRKHTIQLISIIKGSYQDGDIDSLVKSMTNDELLEFRDAIETYEDFKNFRIMILGNKTREKYVLLSWYKIKDNIDTFRSSIEDSINNPSTLSWGWTKGLKTKNCDSEEGIDVAIREFSEESGIVCNHLISSRSVSYHVKSICNMVYNTRCWISVIDKEMSLDDPHHLDNEIKDRRWANEEEVYTLIGPELRDVFKLAVDISRLI